MADLERASIKVRLRQARTDMGPEMTQKALASLMHLGGPKESGHRTIQNWESLQKDNLPSLDQINELARLLDKTPEWLLFGEDGNRPASGDLQGAAEEVLRRVDRCLTAVLKALDVEEPPTGSERP